MNSKLDILKSQLDGELHHDNMMKALYATDASVYREMPLAVALPKNSNDIKKLIVFANTEDVSLIPRAAGTSLAGQCVGEGIVVDVSKYLNEILEINTQEKWVRVQPGVVRDELNTFLKPYGLFFGPNTSTANRCMIGGMVGNNSCGSTSIVYGSTRDHVLEMKTILSDGNEVVFNKLSQQEFIEKTKLDSLEGKIYQQVYNELSNSDVVSEIKKNFPKQSVTRRNTGYAVDSLINSQPFSDTDRDFNFCKLLCGSEGTLAFTTEIKLNLVALPEPSVVLVAAHFNSVEESLKATIVAMKENPTACELMDKTILDCTKNNLEQQKNRFFVDGDPKAILIVEFRGNSLIEAKTKADNLISLFKGLNLGYSHPLVLEEKTEKVWDLRKAGLGLLANIPGDKKTVACIEDTAVAVEDLPEYINAFTALMNSYNQEAVYYAHAGAGELHLRPILDLKNSEDVKLFREMSEASAKLVKSFKGSLSGEHGDGRVRAEFIPLVLGEKNYELFKRIKKVWDSNHIFNPGKIVDAKPMDENLRYEQDVPQRKIDTIFNFEDGEGILKSVEKCNGSGDCRKLNFAGGTMCPSYRATLDEKDTTRGRANILREFLTQSTKENPFDHSEIKEAMDLCISCKGCKSECPSNIDMATFKAEFQFQYYKGKSRSLRDKLIANNVKLNKIGFKFSRLYNFLISKDWIKRSMGIAKERTLPKLSSQTLRSWFSSYKQEPKSFKVYFFCDEYTNFYDVEIGKKAILLLNKLGYEVLMISHEESGRAYISKGFLNQAKRIATANVNTFKNIVSIDFPLIGIEPSAVLSFRDEYINLVDKSLRKDATDLSKFVFLIDEFLANEIDKKQITSDSFNKESNTILLHGHCHQKALSSTDYTKKILSLPLNYTVNEIPSGCCGMAGSFGYEKENFELSQKIANQVLVPAIQNENMSSILTANGTSCRHQIFDEVNKTAKHPIEVLYEALYQ